MALKDEAGKHHRPVLTDDFKYSPYDEWRDAAEKLLKGKPFDKIMLTHTYEEITLKPIYTQSDVKDLAFLDSYPGKAPFTRGTKASGYLGKPWQIAQETILSTPEAFNEIVLKDLKKGQTAAYLILDRASAQGKDPHESSIGNVGISGTSISTLADLESALAGIDLENTAIYIRVFSSGLAIAGMLENVFEKSNIDLQKITGAIEFDPLAQLVSSGQLPASLSDLFDEMASLTKWAIEKAPDIQVIGVLSHFYGDSGANIVQETAYGMATGLTYLKEMIERGLTVDQVAPRLRFSFSIGSNFFMEIAKFRAVKLLWYNIINALGGNENSQKIHVHGRSSAANKTTLDPYVNLLRTTTESFSGILGGIDSLHVSTFDAPFERQDDFSRRIARNQQLILKEEANLEKLIDPAGGSWFIEKITMEISESAWAIFQEIERSGGMSQAILDGTPQAEIEKTVKERLGDINVRKAVIVGSNMYANMNEPNYVKTDQKAENIFKVRSEEVLSQLNHKRTPDPDMLLSDLAGAMKEASIGQYYKALRISGKTVKAKALSPFSWGDQLAGLRETMAAYKEKKGKAADVYLANMGSLKTHKARADFSRGFFEVAGFEVIYPPGAGSPQEAAKGALDSAAKIIVLCSTDETYPDIVPPFVKAVKAGKPDAAVILAGFPKEHVEAFKKAGIDDFIHVRADLFEILPAMMKKAGVM